MNAEGGNMEAGNQQPEDSLHAAETLRPLDEISPAPHWPQPPLPASTRRSRLRAHPLLLLTLSLILVLAGGGSALAAVRGFNGRSIGGATGAQLASATATATFSPTATPSPTIAPTATVPAPVPQKVNLGCNGTLHPLSSVVRSGQTSKNTVALTFDDGPSPDWTASILTTLEQTHTPATFFVVGASARSYPNLIRREAADGVIAMHTWDHPYMTKLTPAARAWELASTANAIHNALGANYCLPYWRPPFGDYNGAVVAQTTAMGLTTVTWSVDPQDWSSPGVPTIVDRVLSAAKPGSIILLHDGYFHRQQTSEALPLIIQGLHDRGLKPVTLPQLLGAAK
ncbi:MAG TPA: polysaccharide deacetylase family protein [Ktedonobacterales bacterium]